MIKVKGMSVFPAEVEMLLVRHPDLASVAVVPADDPRTGQRPVAFVTAREGAPSTPRTSSAGRGADVVLQGPRGPRARHLPLTDTGKIRKGELLGRAQDLLDARG